MKQLNVHAYDMCHDTSVIFGVGKLFIIRLWQFSDGQRGNNDNFVCANSFYLFEKIYTRRNMVDVKVLGERLRILRNHEGLTQKELANRVGVTQTAISRLENGEEVYASALLSVLNYFQNLIIFDDLFEPETHFHILPFRQNRAEKQELLLHQLEMLEKALSTYPENWIKQIRQLKQEIDD